MATKASYINPPVLFNCEQFKAMSPRSAIWVDRFDLDGTSSQSSFYLKVTEALSSGPFRVVINAWGGVLDYWPDNFMIDEIASSGFGLPQLDVVICQGDYVSVCEALSYGLPLIVLANGQVQQHTADWVLNQGAGLKLNFNRFKPNHLENAVLEVLNNIDFRKNAERAGKLFVSPIGVTQAANLLEQLCQIKHQNHHSNFESNMKLVKPVRAF